MLLPLSYFQIPIYFIRTPSSDYKWEVINPIGPPNEFRYQPCPEIDTSVEAITIPDSDHFELLVTGVNATMTVSQ